MVGRVLLSMVLFVAGRSAFGQLLPNDDIVTTPPVGPPPVVTFGSLAMTTTMTGDVCKAVGFSPDSRAVMVFSNQQWNLWDIATGKGVLANAAGANDTLYPCPDGKTILCLGRSEERNGKVRLLDVRNGGEVLVRAFSGTETVVPADDCTALAVVGSRGTTVAWLDGKTADVRIEGEIDVRRFAKAAAAKVFALLGDGIVVQTATGLWKLDPPKDIAYTSVALTADGTTLATASARETDDGRRPGPIELWDVKTRQKLRVVEAVEWFAEAPHRLRFTPDGKTLVAGDGAYLRGWNATTGAKTFAVEPGWGWVGNVQISPDGKHVAVAYPSRPMVYELATGRQPTALLGHSAAVWEVAFSPDGTQAATAMFGRPTIYVWDAVTGASVGQFQTPFPRPANGGRIVPGRVRVQFSPDGSKLLTTNEASGGGTPLRIWDAKTLGLLRELPLPEVDATTVAFTRHGLFAVLDRKPTLVDPNTGKTLWEKPAVPRAARAVVSNRGDRVAVAGQQDTAVWAVADGGEVDRVPGEPLGFTADAAGLVTQGQKHAIRFRDLTAQKDRLVLENTADNPSFVSETGLVGRVVFGPDLVPEFHIYSAREGTLLSTCAGDQNALGRAETSWFAYSRDGRSFAVAGLSGSIRVFETYSGQELARITHGLQGRVLVFSPDGRTLFFSHGGDESHSQVLGHDVTGGAWNRPAVARGEDMPQRLREMADKPATARQAVYHLATRPAEAVAFAREVTQLPTAADQANYTRWLSELDAPAFAVREAATKGLAKGGWRAEAVMRQTLAATDSVEARRRLEKLLVRRDMRPLRAVHLLELIGTPDAVGVLKTIATGPTESLVVQDAKGSLVRLENRPR